MTTKYPTKVDGDGNLAVNSVYGRRPSELLPGRTTHSTAIVSEAVHVFYMAPRVRAEAQNTFQTPLCTIGASATDSTKSTFVKQVIPTSEFNSLNHLRCRIRSSSFESLGTASLVLTSNVVENDPTSGYVITDYDQTWDTGALYRKPIKYQTGAGWAIGTVTNNGVSWVKFTGPTAPLAGTPQFQFVECEGTLGAAATGLNSITLPATASDIDDTYNGYFIKLTDGAGSYEVWEITDYNGTTKVATIVGTPSFGSTEAYQISFEEDCNFSLRVFAQRCSADGTTFGEILRLDEAVIGNGATITDQNFVVVRNSDIPSKLNVRDRADVPCNEHTVFDGTALTIPIHYGAVYPLSGSSGTGVRDDLGEYLAIVFHGSLGQQDETVMRGSMQLYGTTSPTAYAHPTLEGSMTTTAQTTPVEALAPVLGPDSVVVGTISFTLFASPLSWRYDGLRITAGGTGYLTDVEMSTLLLDWSEAELTSVIESAVLPDSKVFQDYLFDTHDFGARHNHDVMIVGLKDAGRGLTTVNVEIFASTSAELRNDKVS